MFKGTGTYPEPGALSEAVEGLWRAVNASTDRELTVYSAKESGRGRERGLEVVSELVLRPLLRKRDLSAEKPVIVDEIRMYEDSPATTSSRCSTRRSSATTRWAGRSPARRVPFAAPREGVVNHWGRWYQPRHLVLAAAGAVTHEAVRQTAAELVRAANYLAGRRPPERAPADRSRA